VKIKSPLQMKLFTIPAIGKSPWGNKLEKVWKGSGVLLLGAYGACTQFPEAFDFTWGGQGKVGGGKRKTHLPVNSFRKERFSIKMVSERK